MGEKWLLYGVWNKGWPQLWSRGFEKRFMGNSIGSIISGVLQSWLLFKWVLMSDSEISRMLLSIGKDRVRGSLDI